MNNQNNNQDNNQNANVISPEEIQLSISGNEVALENQMERIKEISRQGVDEEALKKKQEEERLRQEAEQAAKRKHDEAELKALQAKENAENQVLLEEQQKKKYEEEMIKKAQQEQLMKKQKEEEEKKKAEELKKKQAEEALNKKMQEEEAAKKREIEEKAKKEAEKRRKEELEIQRKKEVEAIKKRKNNNDSNKGRRISSAIILIGLIVLVYFLPNISKLVAEYKANKLSQQKITTGVSNCTLEKSTETLDIKITASFNFVNSKLQKLTYNTVSIGDKTSNVEELNKINQECLKLKDEAGELDGITIVCGLNNNKDKMYASNKQILDYEKLDVKKVTSAYTEAGGIYPEFTKNEDIDKIEGKMSVAGYSCSRS